MRMNPPPVTRMFDQILFSSMCLITSICSSLRTERTDLTLSPAAADRLLTLHTFGMNWDAVFILKVTSHVSFILGTQYRLCKMPNSDYIDV